MVGKTLLHGREASLNALRAGLEGAIGGHGRVAVVSGEAGIGKSAVATALAHEATARGATVTWGRAWEFADAPPYFPLWPCLRSLGLGGGEGRETYDEGQAFQLWERVAGALASASAVVPSVWLLEDLHAADLATLDLLTFLAQPLRAIPALVVATVRANDPRVSDRMAQRLTRMARDGLDVRLEPLSDGDVAALVAETLGRAVPEVALRRLVELTGGNPLFVVECARSFRNAGGIEGTLGSLPPTVRLVVLERVTLLPAATQHALACGAILGREFSAASVARMDHSLPARTIDALLPALRARIVEETRPGHFSFSHALVRDAIEGSLRDEERAALHLRADDALAVLGDTADVLVERARHALSALGAGDPARALTLSDRATELLERDGSFDRAFDLHLRVDEARAAGLLPPATGDRMLHVAHVARAAGRSDQSRRLCEAILGFARASGDAELLARGALLFTADIRPTVLDRGQVVLLEEVLRALGDGAPTLACRARARLATAMQPAPDPAIPRAMVYEALARAKATCDDVAILDVLEIGFWAIYEAPLDARIAWSTELLLRALGANDLPKALMAHNLLAFLHIESGDFEALDGDVASMLRLSDEVGHPRHRWAPLLIASGRACTLGRFADSERFVTEVRELAAVIDDPALPIALAVHEVVRLKTQRRDTEALAAAEKVAMLAPDAPVVQIVAAVLRATAKARLGDVAGTRAEISFGRASLASRNLELLHAPYEAEAHAFAGTDDDRRKIRDLIERFPGKDVNGGHLSFMYEGPVPRLLGLLNDSLGDLAAAESCLREALALARSRGHAPWVAQTAHDLADVLARTGNTAEARELDDLAATIALEIGMTDLTRRPAEAAPAAPECRDLEMKREGDVWRIEMGRKIMRVKDSRGMHLLARLVERPGEEVHVLALSGDDGASVVETHAGDVIDERARRAYRERLTDLEAELDLAEQHGDAGRAARLRLEREALEGEIARAVGLGGRARKSASATERARVNVQRRLKDAIARIADADLELGRFFENAVSTGTFCCFRP